ncbi:hypothetical protein [Microbacterium hydrocarbonoxydans]|uniref:hypothetical protein n=1 Tax=Microbacterium hydrocarbonoxydans TaxID=273678 RepID=UPI0007BB585A|nr:hypothetical protein [Microbacterium hydrocarbonoxydans]GAT72246.1 transcriptional regulatory protein [Microbacterium sp. HM58-2]
MPGSAEHDELRTLQARAYGRHGGLTDAEAARLHELQRALRGAAAASGSARSGGEDVRHSVDTRVREEVPRSGASLVGEENARPGGGIPAEAPPRHANSSGAAQDEADAGAQELPAGDGPAPPVDATTDDGESGPPASAGRFRSPRPRTMIVGAVLIAAAGVALGAAVFGDREPPPVALTGEQQEWQNELLASAEYDAGSLRAIGEEAGAVVWYATKQDGTLACVILSDGENTSPSCAPAEDAAVGGLFGQFRTPAGEDHREVFAQILLDAEGDPAVSVSSYVVGDSGVAMQYATEEEEAIAETLRESGFDAGSIRVVGYDGEVPVWLALRTNKPQECLIYDGSEPDPAMDCADTEELWQGGGSLIVDREDEKDGELTRFEYVYGGGSSYLTLTRGIEPGDASE